MAEFAGLGRVSDAQWRSYPVPRRFSILRKAGYGLDSASRWALRDEVPPGVLGRSARRRDTRIQRIRKHVLSSRAPSIFTQAGQEAQARAAATGTEAWFRRAEQERYASLPRSRGRPLSRNEWIKLRREHPELLRDWLAAGKYSPPPSVLFPQDSTFAMTQRTQRGPVSRGEAPDWSPLQTTSEAARLQAEEMARRGISVHRSSRWSSGRYDQRTSESSTGRQNRRLKALTKDSAGFRRMTTYEQVRYLGKLAPTFQGNRKFASMHARLQRKLEREQRVPREAIAAGERRSDPAWEIKQEQARKRAAAERARSWLARSRQAAPSSTAGQWRAPTTHLQTTRMTTRTPSGTRQGPSVSEQPWVDPRLQRPSAPVAQYSHGRVVAGRSRYVPHVSTYTQGG
jgi:hypothetical protein